MRIGIRQTAKGVVINVRLTPRSAADAIVGVVESLGGLGGEAVLKARVRAVPEDGRANTALETLIAQWLGVPRSSVRVVRGGKSRIKQVSIDGDGVALSALIGAPLAEL